MNRIKVNLIIKKVIITSEEKIKIRIKPNQLNNPKQKSLWILNTNFLPSNKKNMMKNHNSSPETAPWRTNPSWTKTTLQFSLNNPTIFMVKPHLNARKKPWRKSKIWNNVIRRTWSRISWTHSRTSSSTLNRRTLSSSNRESSIYTTANILWKHRSPNKAYTTATAKVTPTKKASTRILIKKALRKSWKSSNDTLTQRTSTTTRSDSWSSTRIMDQFFAIS